MGLKVFAARLFAKWTAGKIRKTAAEPIKAQQKVFEELLRKGRKTAFGKDHGFENIQSYKDFKTKVPVVDYEQLSNYIERIKQGEKDVLWPGLPLYFCKTSGTTSGAKYIPLTKDSLPNHLNSARNALLCYIEQSGNADFVGGKMIFLQGSPKLDKLPSGIPYGRLSGIAANHVPGYLQKNRLPSFETNSIEDWETKVDKIIDETIEQDMTLISGIPSWVQVYFEELIARSKKNSIAEIFPNFSLFVFGGVNFEPYRKRFEKLIGRPVDTVETYPASEGFIAYQDSQTEEGLLLVLDSGIFYEFIPSDEFFNEIPTRLSLADVELDVNYALVLNTNAGLWGYSIGDTIRFVSLNPPRIKVTGRIKHFTSAFGEHVIAEEVEKAMSQAQKDFGWKVSEFHVAPQLEPVEGLPYHEWLVEFEEIPDHEGLEKGRASIDKAMQAQNPYYKDLISGNILQTLKIAPLEKGSFNNYMKSVGRLGGQNKVPRLGNDRKVADKLVTL
jgi:hypothetical protein